MDEFKDKKLPDMRLFPFTVPTRLPYSRNPNLAINIERIRNIACMFCIFQMPSHIYDPICGVCGHEMVTVV